MHTLGDYGRAILDLADGLEAAAGGRAAPAPAQTRAASVEALARGYGMLPRTVPVRAAQQMLAVLDDELDDDDEMDDQVRELIAALEQVTGRKARAWARRAPSAKAADNWNPALHPKWPKGHPQGGKFRPTSGALVDKLVEWYDDPKKHRNPYANPLGEFSTKQLFTVAKKFGFNSGYKDSLLKEETFTQKDRERVEKYLKRLAPINSSFNARRHINALAAGKDVTVESTGVDHIMQAIKDYRPAPFNFARLKVLGNGNENLFQKHLRDRPRETMPQLPTGTAPGDATKSGRTMDHFMEFLDDKGVKYEFGEMDPRELVATQSELSGPKVAKIHGFMAKGWKQRGVMIVCRDGTGGWAVVDGHHRWAAAAARSIERTARQGEPLAVTVLKLDADVDEVLGRDADPAKGIGAVEGVVMDFAEFEALGTDREGKK